MSMWEEFVEGCLEHLPNISLSHQNWCWLCALLGHEHVMEILNLWTQYELPFGSSFISLSLPSYLSPRIISWVDGAISLRLLFSLDMWCHPQSDPRYPSTCILPKSLGKLAPMPLELFWSLNGLPPLLLPLLLELPDPGPGGNGRFPLPPGLVNAFMSILPDIHLEKKLSKITLSLIQNLDC